MWHLPGVYPVGMKIAAKEYPKGLGARLGVLVGALTLGTAFPWLVRGLGSSMPYQVTIVAVSILAFSGAVLMYLVMIPRHGGPGAKFLQSFFKLNVVVSNDNTIQLSSEEIQDDADIEVPSTNDKITHDTFHDEEIDLSDTNIETDDQQLIGIKALQAIFADTKFKAAAIGYFGHCFELYAFWTYVPTLIESHAVVHGGVVLGNVALTSFTTIAIGSLSCTVAGVWSLHAGRKRLPGSAVVAELNLLTSLVCCLLAPVYQHMSQYGFLVYLLIWGASVIADSAQFSSLCATYAHPSLVGTALCLTTCIGYTVTIISIQIIGVLLEQGSWDPGNALALLAIGPIIGEGIAYKEWPLHRLCTTPK